MGLISVSLTTFCEFIQQSTPEVSQRLRKFHRVTVGVDTFDYSLSRVVVELNVILSYTLPVSVSWWRWVGSRVHACSNARPQFWTRVYHTTAQGHSAVLSPISVRLQVGELAHAAGPQLIRLSYLAYALCANKFSSKKGVFGHRVILIWGIETWLGVLRRTQHLVLQSFETFI